MRTLFLCIIFCVLHFKSNCQVIYLETFDSKNSIKSWDFATNGQAIHTNHFSYNGQTYYKPGKDSFIIFFDTAFNPGYRFSLIKTFKVVPFTVLSILYSIFSNDTLNDYLSVGYRIFDKNGNTVDAVSYPSYCRQGSPNIAGSGTQMPDKSDSMWLKADSMTITFRYGVGNPNKKIERIVVIDEIFLQGVTASNYKSQKPEFEIFPNPAKELVNFKFPLNQKPKQIQLLDYTGRVVMSIKGAETINVQNLKGGFYFINILMDNGSQATKKIEIK